MNKESCQCTTMKQYVKDSIEAVQIIKDKHPTAKKEDQYNGTILFKLNEKIVAIYVSTNGKNQLIHLIDNSTEIGEMKTMSKLNNVEVRAHNIRGEDTVFNRNDWVVTDEHPSVEIIGKNHAICIEFEDDDNTEISIWSVDEGELLDEIKVYSIKTKKTIDVEETVSVYN